MLPTRNPIEADVTRILTISDLTIDAVQGGRSLVDGLSMEVHAGETVAVVGESGSGKSLTALSVIGLLPATVRQSSGTISLDLPKGRFELNDLDEKSFQTIRGDRIGMIFQEPMSSFSLVKTVGEQVGEPLVRHRKMSRRNARARVAELLDQIDVPNAAEVVNRYPFEFSGGMLQRAMIARAVCCEPDLIIADEPTTALDVTVQAQVLRLLKRVQARAGSAMLFITHDLAVARQIADRVIVMRSGCLVEQGRANKILSSPRQPYTKELLAAVPRLAPAKVSENSLDDPILDLKDVSLSYRGTQSFFGRPKPPRQVLHDIGVKVPRGSILGLVGESGSGKTTLARAVLGLAETNAGKAVFQPRNGKEILPFSLKPRELKSYWRKAQMVFQNPYASLNPWLNVEQTITEPLINNEIASGNEARALARDIVERCGLDKDALQRFPHSFSGGQRQRIAIARALVMRPEFLVCDEPMSALDVSTQARISALLKGLCKDFGLTVLLITHDLAAASQLCDRIAVMHLGRLVEAGPTETVFNAPASEYTTRLLASIPILETEEAVA